MHLQTVWIERAAAVWTWREIGIVRRLRCSVLLLDSARIGVGPHGLRPALLGRQQLVLRLPLDQALWLMDGKG